MPLTTFHVADVSHAKILLARGTSADLLQAAQILTRLRGLATTIHNTRYLIEVVALEGLLHEARGHRDEALGALKHAVLLAEPTGIIRVFVDLGPKLAILLRLLVSQGVAPTYLLEILSAVSQEHASRSAPKQEALRQPAENADELIQPLTSREMEVLELLGERLSDKEIARELHVSTQTVKRHASNIYQKLGVTNRREAVARAAALGLILQLQSIRQRSRSGT